MLEIQREVEACYSLNVSKNPEVGGEVEILTELNCSDGSGKYRSGTDIYLYASVNTLSVPDGPGFTEVGIQNFKYERYQYHSPF